jgi:hypothetical protein
METSQYDLVDFVSLEVSHAIELKVIQSDEFKVEVTHNENLKKYLVVKQKGNQLILGLKGGHSYKNAKIKAVVTLPVLRAIDASGASSVQLEQIESQELNIDLSGASSISGKVDVRKMNLDASGASTIRLKGIADYLACETSGASDVKSRELSVTQELRIDASGASNVFLICNGDIYADLSGASNFIYYGNGIIRQKSVSGAASIKSKAL